MSFDHLWIPICDAKFPSISNLYSAAAMVDPTVNYRRLYALGYNSFKRRCQIPPKPLLSLDDLLFTFTVGDRYGDSRLGNLAKHGGDLLNIDPNGVFRFDIEFQHDDVSSTVRVNDNILEGVKVTWHVVLKGWKGVFTMVDCGAGQQSFRPQVTKGWFTAELPSPGCCSGGNGSGLVAEVGLELGWKGEGCGEVRVEKVSVGMMSIVNWRYVSVDDGLRYLQHFLVT